MKKKNSESKKVVIEFDEKHLSTLVTALETYSRLQSGQIKMAIDTAYGDRHISYEESQSIENIIRYIAFPRSLERNYDGHGSFYDQYNNEYDEGGSIVKESEEWARKKNHPHLDHPSSSFGVGCKEMKGGTIAFEIKKTIEQYMHYQMNNGFRKVMDVSGDGAMQFSDVPLPKVLSWKPEKAFKISPKYQNSMQKALDQKNFSEAWSVVDKAFKTKPLPRGKTTKIEQSEEGHYQVVVQEPYEL